MDSKFISIIFCASYVWALPIAPIVTAGTAEFIQQENGLRITTDDRAIIHWKDFSIGVDEWTHFNLPSKNALVMNRVISDVPSSLLGRLTSNGQILLLNSNGILIGKEGCVDTAGFMATTLDVCESAFVSNSELAFEGAYSSSTVQNFGIIKASEADVFLIGWHVDNHGAIEAPNGFASAIAAGQAIIRIEGTDRIYVRPRVEGEDPYSMAFMHKNLEDALEVEEIFGEVWLKGSISAKNVSVFGDFIDGRDLTIQAPGGTVLIGGDNKGENQNVINAKHVFLDESVLINVDSVDDGSGGNVVVWSDGHTHFLGQITARGFEGGYTEISGKNHLDFRGAVDLRGMGGEAGTLLLDPIDIVVGTVGAGAFTAGVCSYCTGPALACSIYSTNIPTVLSNTTLASQLLLSNVLLDATVAGGGGGTITINANANIFWNSAFSLGLNAENAINIRACLQNGGTGNVTVQSTNGPITLDASFVPGSGRGVYVGSLSGATTVCSPNADLILRGNTTLGRTNAGAQIGFNRSVGAGTSSPPLVPPAAPGVLTATGPISVVCRNLSLFTGTPTFCSAQIGHGQMDVVAPTTLTTSPAATIAVQVNGNIDLVAFAAGNSNIAVIGHGSNSLAPATSIAGDIGVTCSGNITLQGGASGGAIGVGSRIGHGINSGALGTNFTGAGNISVRAGGNITLQDNLNPSGGGFTCVAIGHFAVVYLGAFTSDVTVTSGGTISVIGSTPIDPGLRMGIGNLNLAVGGGPIRSNVRVSACQDLVLTVNNQAVFALGTPFPSSVADFGNVEVSVGRDLIFTANGTGAAFVGHSFSNPGSVTSTFVSTGRDVSITGIRNVGIAAFGDVNVAAGRNVGITANGTGISYIGTELGTSVPSFTTRVYAAGNVLTTNSAASRAIIGRGVTAFAATHSSSLDVRAGGDINFSANFTNGFATAGTIFLEADTVLPAGALWTSSGGNMSSIATITMTNPTGGAALPIPLPSSCPSSAITTNSPPIVPDNFGGLTFNTGAFGGSVLLSTSSSNITLHSAPNQVNGVIQNLTIGTAADNVNIVTTSGNIEIWGANTAPCARGDSYHDITINIPITTTGSVFIAANNNIDMTTTGSIATPGAVTLVVDNQMPTAPLIGTGSFSMAAGSFINSGVGLLQIYTALQDLNSIDGLLNGLSFNAGTLFANTTQEIWCRYFCTPISVGSPFRIAYKNCLQVVLEQASIIIDEFLVDLHPYNEFPGWMQKFFVQYNNDENGMITEPYYIRRRNLNLFNHPKSYSTLMIP